MSYARSQPVQQAQQSPIGPQQSPNQTPGQTQARRLGPPPGGVTPRLGELLEGIKQEFMQLSSETSAFMIHKDEIDHKLLTQHMNELTQVRKTIYELDAAHRHMKERYEEEILRLKQKLDSRNTALAPAPTVNSSGQGQIPGAPQAGEAAIPHFPLHQTPQIGGQQPSQQAANQQHATTDNSQHVQFVPPAQQGQPLQPGQAPLAQPNQLAATSVAQPAKPDELQGNQAASAVRKGDTATEAQTQPQSQSIQTQEEIETGLDAESIRMGNDLAFLDVEKVPAQNKKVSQDYTVVYNTKAPAQMDVELSHSLKHSSVVCCVRFSADGRYLATGCKRCAQIFDVNTGELVCRLQDSSVGEDQDLYIRSVCFSPDAKYLATGAEDHQIRVWDIEKRQIKHLFTGHEQDIYSLDFSANGQFIVSGSGDLSVRIWDVESGKNVLTLTIEDGVTAVAISPDGRYIAAGSLDRIVRIWEVQSGALVERLEGPDGHQDSVYSVAFSSNGLNLVSGSLDKSIKIWELQAPRGQITDPTGRCIKTINGHRDYVLSVATTPDSNWILSGSKDRTVQVWDAKTGQAQLMLQAHVNSVISVAPSPVGQLFASGSGDFWAKIWRFVPRNSG